MSFKEFKKHIERKAAAKGAKKPARNKYRAKKCQDDAGRTYDSQLERAVYHMYALMQKAGDVLEIQQQDSIYLTDARILYKPDFKIIPASGDPYWVEAKGVKTAVWNIKRRLWKSYGPGRLEVWEGSYTRPKLTETIIPMGDGKEKQNANRKKEETR